MYPYTLNSSSGFQQEIQESRVCFNKGKEEYEDANFSESLDFFQQAVKMQEVLFGKYHQETIQSYLWKGKAACKEGRVSIALTAFQRATRIAEQGAFDKEQYKELLNDIEQCWYEIKPDNDVTLGVMMEIFSYEQCGDSAVKEQRYVEAIESYCQALSLQDSIVGRDSLDGADIRYKLGCSLLRTKSSLQARQTLQLAYDCYVKEVGTEHPASMGAAAKIRTIMA